RLGGGHGGPRLFHGGDQLDGGDLDEKLARLHEVAEVGAQTLDIAADLGKDRHLLVGLHVGGVGELDLGVLASRFHAAGRDLDLASGLTGRRLLLLDAVDHQDGHEDTESEEDNGDAMPTEEGHWAAPEY